MMAPRENRAYQVDVLLGSTADAVSAFGESLVSAPRDVSDIDRATRLIAILNLPRPVRGMDHSLKSWRSAQRRVSCHRTEAQ